MERRQLRQERAVLQRLLRDIRREAGINQEDLARRLGATQSFVSKYESGERRLDLLELRHICTAIGVPLTDVLQRFEAMLAETTKEGT